MKKKVDRKTYLKLLKELRSLAEQHGAKLVLRHRKVKYPNGIPNYGVHGYYKQSNNTCTVHIYGRASRLAILHIAAHEVRHAIHHKLGMYKDYYDPRHEDVLSIVKEKKTLIRCYLALGEDYKLPKLSVAIRAERDCDRFAREFVRIKGFKVSESFVNLYNVFGTMAYQIQWKLSMKSEEVYNFFAPKRAIDRQDFRMNQIRKKLGV